MPGISRRQLQAIGIDSRRIGRWRWVEKTRLVHRYGARVRDHLDYILVDPEVDNFTYDIGNEEELVAWLAAQLAAREEAVARLVVEARSNSALHARLHRATTARMSVKTDPPLGRRIGWYALARLLKPRRIAETGIHDGIGSLVLLSALERNAEEGAPGTLVSFDIDPAAGWIVGSHPLWSRRVGDTRDLLAPAMAESPVQMFLHDSWHTYAHERFELATAAASMTEGVLVSDNSHETSALADVCAELGARYAYFSETPRGHFYPGGGIGLGVLDGAGRTT